MTGSSAAGKSSFCKLLFRSKFSPDYNSTEIMEKKLALSVVEEPNVSNFSMVKQEGEVAWLELNLKNQIEYLKTFLLSEKDKEEFESSSHNHDDDDDDDDDTDEGNDTSRPDKSQTKMVKKIVRAKSFPKSITIEEIKLVTVVDSGGQPEYIHLLPAINIYPTITYIVHDLNKKLDEPAQVRYKKEGCKEAPVKFLNYSNLDMIHLLVCFVTDSLRQPLKQTIKHISFPKESYIGFVGTHYDQVKHDPKIVNIINERLKDIISKHDFVLCAENGTIHPVDNITAGDSKKEGPEVKWIRKQINKKLNEQNQAGTNELPISWMILQLCVQDLCITDHKRYINYEEYKRIAKENASLHDEDEIKASLLYFHFIGILQYFEDPGLCDYIIIDLQWLYNSLAKVMRLSLEDITFVTDGFRGKFNERRLLARHTDCEIKLKDTSKDELEYFFKLLVHLKIIATVKIDRYEYFYLPCMLSNLMTCDEKHKFLLSEPLLIQLKSGFLPRGFFCSLVVHLLEKEPEGWKHQLHESKQNFSDLVIFSLPDKTFLYLYDKIFYLKVEVRHRRKICNTSYHSKIFNELCPYLTKVCSHLSFDEKKLQFGFLCLANKIDCDHIAVVGDLLQIPKPMPNELTCSSEEEHNETKLDESHKMWFEEVSFSIL